MAIYLLMAASLEYMMKKLFSTLSLILITASTMLISAPSLAAPLDTAQQQQVRELIRSTLVENPEILVESLNEMRKREMEVQQNVRKAGLESNKAELFNNPDDPFIGNPNGKLSMVYFADFNCGFCKRQDPILEKMVQTYPDLKIIFKELPVLGPSSREAAELILAAYKTDKKTYKKLQQRLMAKPGAHDTASITAAIQAEGLDVEALRKKVDAKVKAQIDNNLRLASELGIRGTPAMVFTDEIVGGFTDADQLSDKIKARLK